VYAVSFLNFAEDTGALNENYFKNIKDNHKEEHKFEQEQ